MQCLRKEMAVATGEDIVLPLTVKYVGACLAAMGAQCVTHPLDLVKTRMQIGCTAGNRGSFTCLKWVILNEGVLGLYKGITAGLLRQATYVTTRICSYTTMAETYRIEKQEEPSFYIRLAMAAFSGTLGGIVGTPADVVLIRMEADGHAPKAKRRNYKNVANGIVRIYREEGFARLYVGGVPTMIRAAISNSVLLITYPYFKTHIRQRWNLDNGFLSQFSASMLSSYILTICSMPHDMAKTRLQNMRYNNGVPEYSGTIDVWKKVIREKGALGLYKGFNSYISRMGPYTVMVLVFLEQLNTLYFQHILGVQGEAKWL